MPLALAHRRQLLGTALVLFLLAFVAIPFPTSADFGIEYVLFLPIVLVGLSTSPLFGATTGLAAAVVYVIESIAVHGDSGQAATTIGDGLLLASYAGIGALIGKFAQDQRRFTARLTMLADRDSLTGLLNARAHEAALAQRLASGHPFGLVLADMDGLKRLNDVRGHAAGNEALVGLATALAGAVRRNDTVARIGGDEFAILVESASAREAHLLCERLERVLHEKGFTVSLGWSAWPDDALDPRALFERADHRLYEHKAARQAAQASDAPGHGMIASLLV